MAEEDTTWSPAPARLNTEKKDAVDSVVMNFTFDPSEVATEYANCLALVTTDIYPIKLGIVSFEEGGQDAIDQLKAAGIDKVIEAYQNQLNAYLGKETEWISECAPHMKGSKTSITNIPEWRGRG